MERKKLSPEQLEKARLARNAYMRAYRKKNRKRTKELNLEYWARRAERENGGANDAENKVDREVQPAETAAD